MQGKSQQRATKRRDVRLPALLITTVAVFAGGYGLAAGSAVGWERVLGWSLGIATLVAALVFISRHGSRSPGRGDEPKAPLQPRETAKPAFPRLKGLFPVVVGILVFSLLTVMISPTPPRWWASIKNAWSSNVPSDHASVERRREIDMRFRQGVAMLQAKEYEHALTAFHRILNLAPDMPEAYVNAGFAMLGLKRFKEAADFFNDATELRGNQLNAYYGLALALRELGELEAAVGAMRTYTHLIKPDDPFQRRAWAALWEMETDLKIQRGEQPPIPAWLIKPRDQQDSAPQ